MNAVKSFGIITVFLALLVHLNHARSLECLTLCAEGNAFLSCNCDQLPFVKRGSIKLPFRYGKRSHMGYPSEAQYLRNLYRLKSYEENPFLSRSFYDEY